MKRRAEIGSKVLCIMEKYSPEYYRQPVKGKVYQVENRSGDEVFSLAGEFSGAPNNIVISVYTKHFMSLPDEIDRAKGVK